MLMKSTQDSSRDPSLPVQMPSDSDEHRTSTTTKSENKKRTPLADLSNACTPLKQLKPAAPDPAIPGDTPVPGPDSGNPLSPPELTASFVDPGGIAVNYDEPKFSTVYTRRHCAKTIKSKEKEPCTTSSCPPVQRMRSIDKGKGKLVDDTDTERQKAFSIPLQRPKKKQRYVSSEAISKPILPLPRDFLEKQKAYFAEVDAFELVEEVASESELD